ncbi:MAG: M43 family zinc metalloprotease, partial [Haliscomenobacter sp.]
MKSVWHLLVFSLFLTILSCQQDSYFAEDTTTSYDAPTEEAHILINRAARVSDRRSCGSDALMIELLKDPEYALAFRQKMKTVESMASLRATCSNPVRIPVAVHFQGVQSPDRACLEALAVAQIASLTKDYQAANSDLSLWTNTASSSFPGVTVRGACVSFQIANSNHPSGFNLSNGNLAVTINQTTGDRDSRWAGYLNIYVVPNTGYLGYSPLGGAGNGDGVVIDSKAFGLSACGAVGGEAPYNKGRTLTHEVGHYFLLDHIWGDGCAVDDGISDTPNQAAPNYGCPALTVRSCNSLDMHMNYMDYTDDACMYMFSAGQATRMENYISASLSNIVAKG